MEQGAGKVLFRYHDRLEADARRWVEKGLVDEATAERLLDESRSQKRGYSFTSIVVLLGVVCLCFAAMTFVAANWEDMPKLVRVALILTGPGKYAFSLIRKSDLRDD